MQKKPTKNHTATAQQVSFPLRQDPDTVTAIDEFQAYWLRKYNVMLSRNKAINMLVVMGAEAKKAEAQIERVVA